jgi:hypothetical protein
MGEVSKLAKGGQPKQLAGRELGEFDSVKKVSMLGDNCGPELNESLSGFFPLTPTLSPRGEGKPPTVHTRRGPES